jgi:hypothetical protein
MGERLLSVVVGVGRRGFIGRVILGVLVGVFGLANKAQADLCCVLCVPGCNGNWSECMCVWNWTCCDGGQLHDCLECHTFGVCDGSCYGVAFSCRHALEIAC